MRDWEQGTSATAEHFPVFLSQNLATVPPTGHTFICIITDKWYFKLDLNFPP